MGCNWGRGNPSFYEVIKNEQIVVNYSSQKQFFKGCIVLITEGHSVIALGRVQTNPIPIKANPDLLAKLELFNVSDFEHVSYCPVDFHELDSNHIFTYKLQQGIRQVNKYEIKVEATSKWMMYQKQQLVDVLGDSEFDPFISEIETFKFNFISGRNSHKKSYKKRVDKQESEIQRRHGIITDDLYDYLIAEGYQELDISIEKTKLGNLTVDAVIKSREEFILFEVKTSNNLCSNVRQAIGQLLEYAYLDPNVFIQKLVIVGPGKPNMLEKTYFDRIKGVLNVPLEYWFYSFENKNFTHYI